jgi:uncharacterized membrane protein
MDLPSRRLLPTWVPLAILLAAAAYLAIRWDSIPPRWVTHWGPTGVPNGWSERTVGGVFGPLLIGAAVAAFIETVAAFAVRRGRASGLAPLREAQVDFASVMATALAIVFAFLAVELPLGSLPHALTMIVVLVATLVTVGAALAVGARRVSRGLRQVRESGHTQQVEGYHSVFYSNPKDSRLWVPKLIGVGWTLNFSHPLAWPVMVLLVALPIGLVVASIVAAHSAR